MSSGSYIISTSFFFSTYGLFSNNVYSGCFGSPFFFEIYFLLSRFFILTWNLKKRRDKFFYGDGSWGWERSRAFLQSIPSLFIPNRCWSFSKNKGRGYNFFFFAYNPYLALNLVTQFLYCSYVFSLFLYCFFFVRFPRVLFFKNWFFFFTL